MKYIIRFIGDGIPDVEVIGCSFCFNVGNIIRRDDDDDDWVIEKIVNVLNTKEVLIFVSR